MGNYDVIMMVDLVTTRMKVNEVVSFEIERWRITTGLGCHSAEFHKLHAASFELGRIAL